MMLETAALLGLDAAGRASDSRAVRARVRCKHWNSSFFGNFGNF
jgi:hypothetical protein